MFGEPTTSFGWLLNDIGAFFAHLFGGSYWTDDGIFINHWTVQGFFPSIISFIVNHPALLVLIVAPVLVGFSVGLLKRIKNL